MALKRCNKHSKDISCVTMVVTHISVNTFYVTTTTVYLKLCHPEALGCGLLNGSLKTFGFSCGQTTGASSLESY